MHSRVARTRSDQLPCMKSSILFPGDSGESPVTIGLLTSVTSRYDIEKEKGKEDCSRREKQIQYGVQTLNGLQMYLLYIRRD